MNNTAEPTQVDQLTDGISCAIRLREIVSHADLSKECTPERKATHRKQFNECIVKELCTILCEETKRHCQGCRIDHPSQRRHDCCFMDIEERVETFMFDAFRKLDEITVLANWYPSLQELVPNWYPLLQEAEEADMVEAYRLWKTINGVRSKIPTPETLRYWSEQVIKSQTS